jgi:uncharacterized protein (DUF1697 family)
MPQFVALLRGINVGGNNLIRMAELKLCFERQGLTNVATYIQSGNVLFEAADPNGPTLASQLEDAIAYSFGYRSWLALRSYRQMERIVEQAPEGFGKDPNTYRYNAMFLRTGVTSSEAIESVQTRADVDEAWAGDGVLYFSYLINRASQSYISRIVGSPIYRTMTIRNWNTTIKLLSLMRERAD